MKRVAMGSLGGGGAALGGLPGPWPSETLGEHVQVSFLLQYFGGRTRTRRHAQLAARFIRQIRTSAEAQQVSHELLVNVDTPEVREGDGPTITPAVGTSGFVALSPNLGEVRAYNSLARMARGRYLVILQDDMALMEDAGGWLHRSFGLFRSQSQYAKRPLGMLGFAEGVCCVHCPTKEHPNEISQPRCKERETGMPAEAVACATMGPLMIERSLFLRLAGFNETLSRRGTPSTLLDCELSARVWLAGYSVMITRTLVTPSKAQAHVAWTAPGIVHDDSRRCAWIKSTFYSMEIASSLLAVVRLTNTRQLDCEGAKSKFPCPAPIACGSPCIACTRASNLPHAGLASAILRNQSMQLEGTEDLEMRVGVSFLMQYWAGGETEHDSRLATACTALETLQRAARAVTGLRSEILINDDSWNVRYLQFSAHHIQRWLPYTLVTHWWQPRLRKKSPCLALPCWHRCVRLTRLLSFARLARMAQCCGRRMCTSSAHTTGSPC